MRSSVITGLFIMSATIVTAWTQNSLAHNSASPQQSQSVNIFQVAGANVSSLNYSVYNYAANRIGQQVGDGECATLVSEALKAAGAQNFWELGRQGYEADYTWGALVATITPRNKFTANIAPGDIIQFRNVSTEKIVTYSDGSSKWYNSNYKHHTAIVKGVSGSQIYVLHQNVADKSKRPDASKIVHEGTIDVNDIKSGTMWVYRPIKGK